MRQDQRARHSLIEPKTDSYSKRQDTRARSMLIEPVAALKSKINAYIAKDRIKEQKTWS